MMSCASGNSRRLSIKFMCVTLPYMSISAGIVVTIALHEINAAPNSKPRAQRDNQSLQNTDCAAKKCHSINLSFCRFAALNF